MLHAADPARNRRVCPQCQSGTAEAKARGFGKQLNDLAGNSCELCQRRPAVYGDENYRANIDLAATENFTFRGEWIRAYPHAVLQVAEALVAQIAAQSFALRVLSRGHVEEHEPPLAIPGSRPCAVSR